MPAIRLYTLRFLSAVVLIALVVSACMPEPLRQVRLTIESSEGGSVNVNGVTRSLPLSTTFPAGTTVTLLAIPLSDYEFRSWTGDHISADNPTSFVLDSTTILAPTFAQTPSLVVTPAIGEFGEVQVGSTRSATFTIANHGGGILTGVAETSAPFSVVEGAAFHLVAGASQQVTISFTPSTEGSVNGVLTLDTNQGAAKTVHLSGTGSTAPVITRDLGVVVSGSGTVFSEPIGIVCPGTCAAPFAVGTKVTLSVAPSSAVLEPQWANCDAPAVLGAAASSCEIELISDRNVFADFSVAPSLVLTPESGDFGGVVVGGARELTFTLANHGGGTISGTAAAASPFSVVSGAAINLNSGQSQAVVVRFTPSETGNAVGELVLAGDANRTVDLSGSGIAPPAITRRVSVTVTGNGRVTSEPGGIDCPGSCAADYGDGSDLLLSATPASPLGTAEWTGCDLPSEPGSTAAHCQLTLSSERSIQVEFPQTDDVTVTVYPGGATLFTEDHQSFTATVSGTADTDIIWTASGGNLVGTGSTVTYAAPETAGSYVITATSVADPSRSAQVTVIVDARVAVQVAAGTDFSLALKNDGTVWSWGSNEVGQLGVGAGADAHSPVQTGLFGIVKVVAADRHALALRSDGTVWTWGADFGTHVPQRNWAISDAIDIATGNSHALVLTADGNVLAWGANHMGQLGDGTDSDRWWPQEVIGISNIRAIAAGGNHSLAVDEAGIAYAWGLNSSGQAASRWEWDPCYFYYLCVFEPRPVGFWADAVPTAGGRTSMMVTSYGFVHAWGHNGLGDLGVESSDECWHHAEPVGHSCSFSPIRVNGLPSIRSVASGSLHSVAVADNGNVYAWGSNMAQQLGAPSSDGCRPGATPDLACSKTPLNVPTLTGAIAVGAGHEHSLAVLSNGTVWSWGSNTSGQLGDGTTFTRPSPVLVQLP